MATISQQFSNYTLPVLISIIVEKLLPFESK